MSFESLEIPEDNAISPIIELMLADREQGREALENWKDRQQEILDRNNPRDYKEVLIKLLFIIEKEPINRFFLSEAIPFCRYLEIAILEFSRSDFLTPASST